MKSLFSSKNKAFTLIELLIVIGILAVLATVTLLVLNPAQMVKQSRDANRITELNQINQALLLYQSFGGSTGMGTTGKIYVSIPCDSSDYSSLPTPPNGYTYACSNSSSYRNVDGTGWIPVNLTSVQSSAGTLFSALPIDPINTVANGYYYTYIPGSWALSATMESEKYLASNAANDGGKVSSRFETGNNLALDINLPANTGGGIVNPTVTAINSKFAYNNASFSLTSITGTGFASGATVKLTQSGQSDITCSGITVASATSITGGSCPITGANPGTWNVVVTNTDTGTGIGSNLFTVFNSSGLVGYWKFDEGSGTTAIDSSGNNNTGTLFNGPTWITAGKVNGALSFDGVDDYVTTADINAYVFTIEAWVKVLSYNDNGTEYYINGIIDKTEPRAGYFLRCGDGTYAGRNMLRGGVYVGGSWHELSGGVLDLNTWYHIAMSFDNSTLRVYQNGVEYSVAVSGSITPTTNALWFGTDQRGRYGNVVIDEVHIYNRVLSADEISAIYNAQK
jgi:prepilin-type N-terminal cleavage/methylation domain-containing protein